MAYVVEVVDHFPLEIDRDFVTPAAHELRLSRTHQTLQHAAPGGNVGVWPEIYQPQYSLAPSELVEFRGELIWSPPRMTTFIGLLPEPIRGELQGTPPDLITWGWAANFSAEGRLSANLTTAEWAANFRGELQWPFPDLILFPGWAAIFLGEGLLTADLTAYGWAASFRGEGLLTAELESYLAANFRGELQFTPPNLTREMPSLVASFRAEGRLQADLLDLEQWAGADFVDGVLVPGGKIGILYDTISITENIGGGNRCVMDVQGAYPQIGELLEVENVERLFFTGHILTRRRYYIEGKAIPRTSITAVANDWKLTRRRISARFRNMSATEVIKKILARSPGFDLSGIQEGLPIIKEITFEALQLRDAMTKTLDQVEGHWRLEYPNTIIAAVTETTQDPEPLTPDHKTLRDFDINEDLSTVVNRLEVRGAGATLVAPLPYTGPDAFNRNDMAYSKTIGYDRTKIYPPGITRLYLDRIEIHHEDEKDELDRPFNPPKKVPPSPIFNPNGAQFDAAPSLLGKVVVDGVHLLEYNRVGKDDRNPFMGPIGPNPYSSPHGTRKRPTWAWDTFSYGLTLSTQWGETTIISESGVRELARKIAPDGGLVIDDDGMVETDDAFDIEISPTRDPLVTSQNLYRHMHATISGQQYWVKVGAVPASGGIIHDRIPDGPIEDGENERPVENTASPPPLPYIDLAEPLPFPLRVGASVRVIATVDDLESQQFLANIFGPPDDGVVEDILDDSDLTYDKLEEVARAVLKVKSMIRVAPSWNCEDPHTRAGAMQAIDMPDLEGNFKIQTVTIRSFIQAGHRNLDSGLATVPRYFATAANQLVSLDLLLRRAKGK